MSATIASPPSPIAATATPAKLCNGTVLAPIRMAEAATASAQKSFLTRATAAGGYVPPGMRKTSSFPDTPKSVTSVNSASREEFPTLGTPKSAGGGAASWTQIRTRFHPESPATGAAGTATPTATPTPSTPVAPTSSTNQFAALDEDTGTETPKSSVINFKQVIADRIQREEAERLGLYEAEPTDPWMMSREQLERNGWAVLSLPPAEGEARKAWVAERAARQVEHAAMCKAREEVEEVMGVSYTVPMQTTTRRPVPPPSEDEEDVCSVGHDEAATDSGDDC